jgi:hypothetical protein
VSEPQAEPIVFCKRSTITEAWALVQGLPAPVDRAAVHLVRKRAGKQIEDLTDNPVFVVTPGEGKVDPHWSAQVSWGNGRYHARFGHRYLSVHFVRQSEETRYRTYGETMEPHIRTWLGIYQSAFESETEEHPVDRVLYGYANTFHFDFADDFDLSALFRLNYGVSLKYRGSMEDFSPPLLGMGSSFRFPDVDGTTGLTVELNADTMGLGAQGEPPEKKLRVITKVVANKRVPDGTTFADRDRLLKEFDRARQSAKRTFFGFTTEKTHDVMGAVRKNA